MVVGAGLVGADVGAVVVGADEVGAVVALVADDDAVGLDEADEGDGLGLLDRPGLCAAGEGSCPRAGSSGLGETLAPHHTGCQRRFPYGDLRWQ